jgi:hypothetical protein
MTYLLTYTTKFVTIFINLCYIELLMSGQYPLRKEGFE